jgi:hypothetical protein
MVAFKALIISDKTKPEIIRCLKRYVAREILRPSLRRAAAGEPAQRRRLTDIGASKPSKRVTR